MTIGRLLMCLFSAAALAACLRLSPSPDSTMIERFWRVRPDLEKVVAMTGQEHGLHRIATDFVQLDDDFAPTVAERRAQLSDDRWAEYRRLFRRARLPDGVSFGPERVYFFDYATGFAGSGERKGYVWSPVAPSPLVGSLDDAADKPGPTDVFRHIDGPWYLEYTDVG
jgi:hypothetical protein